MACGGCRKKAAVRVASKITKDGNLLGGYKYLSRKQINIRLETYKRRFCKDCGDRYSCDYESYLKCSKRLIK
jgi:hypothetical protein